MLDISSEELHSAVNGIFTEPDQRLMTEASFFAKEARFKKSPLHQEEIQVDKTSLVLGILIGVKAAEEYES